jgi:hypothetical protein
LLRFRAFRCLPVLVDPFITVARPVYGHSPTKKLVGQKTGRATEVNGATETEWRRQSA